MTDIESTVQTSTEEMAEPATTATTPAGTLALFMKSNMKPVETSKYVASTRFVDPATGKALEWEIRAVSSDANAKLREASQNLKRTPGKNGYYMTVTDTEKYMSKLVPECIVTPDLKNAELQNSFGVMGESALLHAMLIPGEYDNLCAEVMRVNGYADLDALVDNAKN